MLPIYAPCAFLTRYVTMTVHAGFPPGLLPSFTSPMSRKLGNQGREAMVLFVCRAKELCRLEVALVLDLRFYPRRCHAGKWNLIAVQVVLSAAV